MNYQNQYLTNQYAYNPYGQQVNAYGVDRQNQFNYPQQVQQNNFTGKFVNDFSEITANDVPMNVPASIFVKTDGSEIQIRSWNGNGLIETKSYKPILDDLSSKASISSNETQNEQITHFNEVLDGIKANVDTILASMETVMAKKTTSRAKKESDAE